MAVTITTQTIGTTNRIVRDTAATNTAVLNITGTTGKVYFVHIDNSANSNSLYLKLWDALAVTVGTTVPDYVLRVNPSSVKQYAFTAGLNFTAGVSYAVVDSGGTAGTTAPGTPISIWMITN